MSIRTWTKDPNAVLDYTLDWTKWLDGDTIDTATFTVPNGLTLDDSTNDTVLATAWLSGGTAGTSYVVRCRITTAGLRTEDRSFTILVDDR